MWQLFSPVESIVLGRIHENNAKKDEAMYIPVSAYYHQEE